MIATMRCAHPETRQILAAVGEYVKTFKICDACGEYIFIKQARIGIAPGMLEEFKITALP